MMTLSQCPSTALRVTLNRSFALYQLQGHLRADPSHNSGVEPWTGLVVSNAGRFEHMTSFGVLSLLLSTYFVNFAPVGPRARSILFFPAFSWSASYVGCVCAWILRSRETGGQAFTSVLWRWCGARAIISCRQISDSLRLPLLPVNFYKVTRTRKTLIKMAGRPKGKKAGRKVAAKKPVEVVEDTNSEEEAEAVPDEEVEESETANGNGVNEEGEDEEDPKPRGEGRKAAKKTPAKAAKGKRGRSSAAATPAKKTKKAQSEEDEDEEYEVDQILAVRVRGGKRVFSIKWKGYSAKSATWEPEENLTCQELLDEFLSRNPEDNVPRPRRRLSASRTGTTPRAEERKGARERSRMSTRIVGTVNRVLISDNSQKSQPRVLANGTIENPVLVPTHSNLIQNPKHVQLNTEQGRSSLSLVSTVLVPFGLAVSVGAGMMFANWNNVQESLSDLVSQLKANI